MTVFGIGNKEKLLKRGALQVYEKDMELLEARLQPGDTIVHEDDVELSTLVKQFAQISGVKIAKASSQLPLTATETEILKRRIQSGEQVETIAKAQGLDVMQTLNFAIGINR